MLPLEITDQQWQKILPILRACPQVYVGKEDQCRKFVSAILWMARSGAPWRLLPKDYGDWNSIYKRFARWSQQQVFENLLGHFADDADLEQLLIDATVIRAHPCAAGAPKKRGGQQQQALGRSRGGFSTKIHIAVDALGNPLRLLLTGGQTHDISQAVDLIDGYEAQMVIADKGYDADPFVAKVGERGMEVVIPPRRNRQQPRTYDAHWYRRRHLVECFINKLKHYRRVFSRFEKLAKNYLGFLSFVSALIWLR